MTSMTGYAYSEQNDGDVTVSVEIKSYNSRFLDLTVNLPPFLSRLEGWVRESVAAVVVRGKVDVFIRLREEQPRTDVVVNMAAVQSYVDALSSVACMLGRPQEDIPLSLVVQQEGVLSSRREYDIDAYQKRIEPVFQSALSEFISDRRREGMNLKVDLLGKLGELEEAASFFERWQPEMEAAFKENVVRRFQELLGDSYDEQRVLTEVASLLVKYTINEEIVRLKSHLAAMRNELEESAAPGRKIDFICQEINREINTIGSKNQFTEVGAMVITAKNALENIREQARNVE